MTLKSIRIHMEAERIARSFLHTIVPEVSAAERIVELKDRIAEKQRTRAA